MILNPITHYKQKICLSLLENSFMVLIINLLLGTTHIPFKNITNIISMTYTLSQTYIFIIFGGFSPFFCFVCFYFLVIYYNIFLSSRKKGLKDKSLYYQFKWEYISCQHFIFSIFWNHKEISINDWKTQVQVYKIT